MIHNLPCIKPQTVKRECWKETQLSSSHWEPCHKLLVDGEELSPQVDLF